MDYLLLAGLLLTWALLIAVVAVLYQVIQQNGRNLVRLEAIEQWLSQPEGDPFEVEDYLGTLPVGVPAPAIDLPDLYGVMHSLAEWRGQRVLLVFFDPTCTFSRRLLSYLVALNDDPVAGRPVPVVVSTGDLEANREVFEASGFRHPVLLQSETEVAVAYKADGTPMSYLIDVDGTLASELAAGVQATLILAGEMAAVSDATQTESGAINSPSEPVTLRDGIKPGSTAPVFRLPKLDGGELSLLEYRGRDVLLVFADPDCEPCRDMLPRLQRIHEEHPDAAVVMISRGDPGSNREMVRDYGLTFPLALQRHWEVSREYGIFAAPAAFHVDEWGVTVASVAVGAEAVLSLIEGAAGEQDRRTA